MPLRGGLHGTDAAAPAERNDRLTLDQREDMRLAKKSLKILRGLCKEYGLAFRLPPGSAFSAGRRGRHAQSSSARAPAGPEEGNHSSSSSSSSSFEFSSEEEKEGLCEHTKWEAVQGLLSRLQTKERVRALKDISKSLNTCSVKAEEHLHELDLLEQSREAGGSSASSGESVEADGEDFGTGSGEDGGPGDALLGFAIADMPVAHALRRCIGIVPELRRLAARKEEARRREALARVQEELQIGRPDNVSAADDSEPEDKGLAGEVERKLRHFGELPADADPDLRVVLEAQRAEARALVQRIKEGERDAQVRRLALGHVDGKAPPEGVDPELITTAVSMAQEMKAAAFAEKRGEAERQRREEQGKVEAPTEQEVQDAIDECARLQSGVERANEQIKRMQEQAQQRQPSSELGPGGGEAATGLSPMQPAEASPSAGPRRRVSLRHAVTGLGTGANWSADIDKAVQSHPQLKLESADLEEAIAAEDKRAAAAEGLLKNAEQTLKVLEEAKILFLEQVARERPKLIEELLAAEGVAAEESSDAGSEGTGDGEDLGGVPGDRDEEESEEAAAERLLALRAEESWLREQLLEAEVRDAENGEQVAHGDGEEEATGDPLVQEVWKLVRRVEAEASRVQGSPLPQGADAADVAEDLEDPEFEAIEHLTAEEAAERLRCLPQEEIRSLLRLRDENARLLEKVTEAQHELDRLRTAHGATEELLGDVGVPAASAAALQGAARPQGAAEGEAPDPELVAEVRRKVRELQALRRRWWSERQDPCSTVRRTLAVVGLPEAEGDEDQPPAGQASLFERIYQAMTLP